MDQLVIQLKNPVRFGSEEIFELKLREPTVADLIDLDLPIKENNDPDFKKCLQWIAKLSGLPYATVIQIKSNELFSVLQRFSLFFTESFNVPLAQPQQNS